MNLLMSKFKNAAEKIASTLVTELEQSTYYNCSLKVALEEYLDALGATRQINKIVCYGLGKFFGALETSSRYQLALLLLLYKELKQRYYDCLDSVIDIYDPCFEQSDIDTLKQFSGPEFNLIMEDEHCARTSTIGNGDKQSVSGRCTLFYMPHLDKHLYDNLIGANWHQESLSSLLILGNSFTEMVLNEILSRRKTHIYYLNLIVSNFNRDLEPITNFQAKGRRRRFRKYSIKREGSLKLFDTISTNTTRSGGGTKDDITDSCDDLPCLIEFPIDDSLCEHSNIFNSMSFHAINLDWITKNKNLIDETKLVGWDPKLLQ